jgi:hypothetical protein
VEGLKQQLLDAGLSPEKVAEIIGKQTFSIESLSQGALPPAGI